VNVAAMARMPSRMVWVRWLRDFGVYVALLGLVLFDAAFTSHFLTVGSLQTQLYQVAPVALVAMGMALVIGTAGIDLSVGAVMALASAVLPLQLGFGFAYAVGAALLAGAACGLFNGVLVAFVRVQPIVATLALFVGGRGLAQVLTGGELKEVFNPTLLSLGSDRLLGVADGAWLAAVVAAGASLLIHRTTFGRQLVAVGGSRPAAVLAGLPVRRTLIVVYIICAMLAALAGVLETAQLQAADAGDIGLLVELSAITAVVVGGTPLSGGRVRVLGTLAGALLMQLVTATLIAHNLSDGTSRIVQAAIIVAAVYIQRQELHA
jgi:ribose/xylose/arabinose/galactoside ABC-type transport system permease subunit